MVEQILNCNILDQFKILLIKNFNAKGTVILKIYSSKTFKIMERTIKK